jgi:hypothetical protein
MGMNDGIHLLAIRGTLKAKTQEEARNTHNMTAGNPDGVDVWMDAEGMGRFYSDPKHLAPLKDVFSGAPAMSTWKQPAGNWIEW